MAVVAVNAGSSSLKLTCARGDGTLERETIDDWDGESTDAIAAFVERCAEPIEAFGHRIVHGGEALIDPVLLDPRTIGELRELTPLAPLHQPRSLAGIDAVTARFAEVPAIACFDTAFHAHLPVAARTYALPAAWRERWPLRRFGFHGLSHASVARRLAAAGHDPPPRRIVSCHLGSGASLCAIVDGRSVDTTMGFTPLEGIVMAQRSGSVDPGLLLWLLDGRLPLAEVNTGLEHESGVRGLAGGSGDLRDVLERRAHHDPDAALALDVYIHALVRGIGAMVASAGGLDALVFTGGVGENADEVRRLAAERLAWAGVRLAEESTGPRISPLDAPVSTWVLPAEEDVEIIRAVRTLLDAVPSPS
jgi:acetate kinase